MRSNGVSRRFAWGFWTDLHFPAADAWLDTTRCVESICKVSLDAGILRLLVPGVVVGEFIDRQSVADGVEVTR